MDYCTTMISYSFYSWRYLSCCVVCPSVELLSKSRFLRDIAILDFGSESVHQKSPSSGSNSTPFTSYQLHRAVHHRESVNSLYSPLYTFQLCQPASRLPLQIPLPPPIQLISLTARGFQSLPWLVPPLGTGQLCLTIINTSQASLGGT